MLYPFAYWKWDSIWALCIVYVLCIEGLNLKVFIFHFQFVEGCWWLGRRWFTSSLSGITSPTWGAPSIREWGQITRSIRKINRSLHQKYDQRCKKMYNLPRDQVPKIEQYVRLQGKRSKQIWWKSTAYAFEMMTVPFHLKRGSVLPLNLMLHEYGFHIKFTQSVVATK